MKQKINVQIGVSLDIEQITEAIVMDSATFNKAPEIIAAIDLACADWGITERLIAHFKAIELEMKEEDPDSYPVAPKKIKL